jgi:RNA polymerase sigma factor (sigma-70 family)|nr:sigma-70 family RNA polymerase sigma factor [Ligilactobacillus acidipiscis]
MNDEALNYLLENNRIKVIYGVLKQLHVSPTTAYFEDLVAEGELLFIQAYIDYQRKNEELNEQQLMGYAFRKIKWGLLDLLRKEWKQEAKIVQPTKQDEEQNVFLEQVLSATEPALVDNYEFWELVREIIMICNENERKFLIKRLFYGYSVAEIAEQEGVSRQTVNYWKNRLKQKSQKLFKLQ